MADDKVLVNLEKNYKKLIENLKKCNNEEIVIKEEIDYLDSLLESINSENKITNTEKEVKIDFENLKMIKEKHRNKFINDFSSWKANKLIEADIPNQINQELDRLFNDRTFLFKEYETYDRDTLDEKRYNLFDKINVNIRDYALKEWGDISLQEVKELIQIQLSTLLKSYENHPPRISYSEENVNRKIEYGELIKIKKDFLFKHKDSIGLKRGQTITSKQRKQIEKILEEDYLGVKIDSLLSKLRYDGFARPQDRNR